MSSLLALILVTQSDDTPTLTFAWPPRPRPIPRLDRPVYKPSQSRVGGVDPVTFSETRSNSRPCFPKEDPAVLHYVRGFKKDGGSSEEELDVYYEPTSQPSGRNAAQRVISGGSLNSSLIRRKANLEGSVIGDQDEDSTACPGSFYWANANESLHQDRSIDHLDTDQYLGFARDDWADMLKTRNACKHPQSSNRAAGSGRKLELVIDSLAIIGHPSAISQQSAAINIEASFERGRTRTRSGGQELTDRQASTTTRSDSASDCNPLLPPFNNHRNTSSSREGDRIVEMSSARPSLTNPTGSQIIPSEAAPLAAPSIPATSLSPLPIMSPTPSRPPPGPVSQLTRMMTPSRSSHVESSPLQSLHHLTSTSNRSASSPSPTTLQRVTCQPSLGSGLNQTRSILAYSPLDSSRSIATPAPDDDLLGASTRLVPLQSFTLALIIDTPPASHLSQHLEVYYQDVVLKVTAALKRLERQSSYLTRESQKINRFEIDRRDLESHGSRTGSKHTSTEEMLRRIERHSDLARALAQIFDDLKESGRTSVTFDNQLDLELLLHRELFDHRTGSDNWLNVDEFPGDVGEEDRYTHLETWKSLLLLEDPQVLIEQAPPQSLLRDFITIIKPALTTLIYWRKAKITDVVTLRNTYQLAPLLHSQADHIVDQDFPPALPFSALKEEFTNSFPNLPHLVPVLSLISKQARQPFSSILPTLEPGLDKAESMAILVWLLKRDLVCRERTHVRLKDHFHPESQIRTARDEVSTSPATRQISIRPSLAPIRGSFHRASSPLINSLNNRSISNLQRQQSQTTVPNLATSATHSTSDYSTSIPSNHLRRVEPGSAESLPSLNELGRRHRRRIRQLSVQSGGSCHSGEISRVEELEDGYLDEEDEILGEPGKATPTQRRWLDELCVEKTETVVTTLNLISFYSAMTESVRNGEQSIRASVTENPFLHPQAPSWTSVILILLAIWRILAMVICVAILAIITLDAESAASLTRILSFNVTVILGGSSIPYIVPNRSMIISLCEFVSNGTYSTLAMISYIYFFGDHDHRMEELMSVWYGIAVLPYVEDLSFEILKAEDVEIILFSGLILAFRLQLGVSCMPARLLTPVIYNLAWIFWLLFMILTTLYLASTAGEVEVSTFELAYPLSEMLQRAAKLWNMGQTLSKSSTEELFAQTDVVLGKVELLSWKFREWGYVWIVLGIFLTMLYVSTSCCLLRTVKRLISSRELTNLSRPGVPIAQIELEKEFRFLSRSCLIISITLGLDIALAVFTTLYSSHLERPIWVTAEALICHIPGLFMSPFLLYQSWRILTGNNAAEDSEFHEATQTTQTRRMLDLPSHLLGWNTTLEWSKYEPKIENENFSGLCQNSQPEEIPKLENGKRRASQMSISSQMFITQSVTTIHHDKDDRDDEIKAFEASPRRYV
ncbi:hypothetical protein DFH28DRAFT_1119289 [Melampsora americana]|nr:hypothetical protein DFH28DRAFT_1119289 [Melampsora americana]